MPAPELVYLNEIHRSHPYCENATIAADVFAALANDVSTLASQGKGRRSTRATRDDAGAYVSFDARELTTHALSTCARCIEAYVDLRSAAASVDDDDERARAWTAFDRARLESAFCAPASRANEDFAQTYAKKLATTSALLEVMLAPATARGAKVFEGAAEAFASRAEAEARADAEQRARSNATATTNGDADDDMDDSDKGLCRLIREKPCGAYPGTFAMLASGDARVKRLAKQLLQETLASDDIKGRKVTRCRTLRYENASNALFDVFGYWVECLADAQRERERQSDGGGARRLYAAIVPEVDFDGDVVEPFVPSESRLWFCLAFALGMSDAAITRAVVEQHPLVFELAVKALVRSTKNPRLKPPTAEDMDMIKLASNACDVVNLILTSYLRGIEHANAFWRLTCVKPSTTIEALAAAARMASKERPQDQITALVALKSAYLLLPRGDAISSSRIMDCLVKDIPHATKFYDAEVQWESRLLACTAVLEQYSEIGVDDAVLTIGDWYDRVGRDLIESLRQTEALSPTAHLKREIVARTLVNTFGYIICADAVALSALSDPDFLMFDEDRWRRDKRINPDTALGKLHLRILNTVRTEKRWKVSTAIWKYALGFDRMSEINRTYVGNWAPNYISAVMYAMGLLAPVARDDFIKPPRQAYDAFVEIAYGEQDDANALRGILSKCGEWFFTSLLECPLTITEKKPLARSEDEAKCAEGAVLCTMSQRKSLVSCAGEVLKKHYDEKDLPKCFRKMFQGDYVIPRAVLAATHSMLKDIKRMPSDTPEEVSELLAAAHTPLSRARNLIDAINPKDEDRVSAFSSHVSKVLISSMSLFEVIVKHGPHRVAPDDDEHLVNALLYLYLFWDLAKKRQYFSQGSFTRQHPLKILESLLSWPPASFAKNEQLATAWVDVVFLLRKDMTDVDLDADGESSLVNSIKTHVESLFAYEGKDALSTGVRDKLSATFPEISATSSPETKTPNTKPTFTPFRISAPAPVIDLGNDEDDGADAAMDTADAFVDGGGYDHVDDGSDDDDGRERDGDEDTAVVAERSNKRSAPSEPSWLLASDKKRKKPKTVVLPGNVPKTTAMAASVPKKSATGGKWPLISKEPPAPVKDIRGGKKSFSHTRNVIKPVTALDLALDSASVSYAKPSSITKLMTKKTTTPTVTTAPPGSALAKRSSHADSTSKKAATDGLVEVPAPPPTTEMFPSSSKFKRSSMLRNVTPPPLSTSARGAAVAAPPQAQIPTMPPSSASRLKLPGRGRLVETIRLRPEDYIRDVLQQSREALQRDKLMPEPKDIHLEDDAPIAFTSGNEYCEFFIPLIIAELRHEASRNIEAGNLDSEELSVVNFHPGVVGAEFSVVEFAKSDQRVDQVDSRGRTPDPVRFKVDDLVLIESSVSAGASGSWHSKDRDALSPRKKEDKPYVLGWVEAVPGAMSSKTPLRVRVFLGGNQATLRHNKISRAFAKTASSFTISRVSEIQNQLRELRAVIDASRSSFFPSLIKPTKFPLRQSFGEWVDPRALDVIQMTLNQSQLDAVVGATSRPHESNEKVREAPVLIQGPPGTGKTHVIVSLIAALLNGVDEYGEPRRARILCAAQSNGAIDEIVERVVDGWDSMDDEFRALLKGVNVVRIGSDEKIVEGSAAERCHVSRKLREIGTDPNAADVNTYAQNSDYYLRQMDEAKKKKRGIESKIQEETKRLKMVFRDVRRDYGYQVPVQSANLDNLRAQLRAVYEVLDLAEKKHKEKLAQEGRAESVPMTTPFERVIDRANIVCGTLSSMAQLAKKPKSNAPNSTTNTRPDAKQLCAVNLFDVVVIDEASQAVEPAALIPMQWLKPGGLLVLIGDPKQLAPTIVSKAAKNANFEQSLFDRLQRAGTPAYLLHEQYRMHPEIMKFPSSCFYSGRLRCGYGSHDEERRAPYHGFPNLGPYQFFHVPGAQMHRDRYGAGTHSWSNSREAEFVSICYAQICRHAARDVRKICVGIITPYVDQVRRIREFLQCSMKKNNEFTTYAPVDVCTMDQTQGQEFDAVIISCVRARPAPARDGATPPTTTSTTARARERDSDSSKGVGFLNDARRVNVALTRARLSCWIVGDASVLSTNQLWGALIENATERAVFVKCEKNEPLDAVFDDEKCRMVGVQSYFPLQPSASAPAPVANTVAVLRNTEAIPATRFTTKVLTRNDPRHAARARNEASKILQTLAEIEGDGGKSNE